MAIATYRILNQTQKSRVKSSSTDLRKTCPSSRNIMTTATAQINLPFELLAASDMSDNIDYLQDIIERLTFHQLV